MNEALQSYNEIRAVWDKKWAEVEKADKEAADKKQLVGRYIQEGIADGYAVYQITGETSRRVNIQVVTGIGDDWVIPYWGERTTIDKQYAIKSIAGRETLSKLFGSERV